MAALKSLKATVPPGFNSMGIDYITTIAHLAMSMGLCKEGDVLSAITMIEDPNRRAGELLIELE